jgi:hypothetical protein
MLNRRLNLFARSEDGPWVEYEWPPVGRVAGPADPTAAVEVTAPVLSR